jgi:hypothetical protein
MEKQSELPGSIYISGFDDDIIDITGLDEEDRKKLKPKVEGLVVDKTFEWFWSDDATTSTKGISSIVGLLGGKYKDDLEKKWDDEISKIEDSNAEKQKELRIAKLTEEVLRLKQMQEKSKNLTRMFLPAASPINPLGGIDTVDFDGEIVSNKITVDEYNPTILATLCYPYATKASPTVCVDPQPFDDKQEKVCSIGGQTLEIQGAPVAVTKIEQEASTNKIQFKIYVSNLGSGDVIKTGDSNNKEKGSSTVPTLDRCSPLGGGVLDRKDFDRVQLKKVQIGDVDLLKDNKCSPFADGTKGTDNLIRLFNGEGFVICTLEVPKLGDIQSAYTTPLNIELRYNYRSTISKNIKISKLTTI